MAVAAAVAATRRAKRKLDETPFYGATLTVRYAPEYESEQDVRDKLLDRRRTMTRLLRGVQR